MNWRRLIDHRQLAYATTVLCQYEPKALLRLVYAVSSGRSLTSVRLLPRVQAPGDDDRLVRVGKQSRGASIVSDSIESIERASKSMIMSKTWQPPRSVQYDRLRSEIQAMSLRRPIYVSYPISSCCQSSMGDITDMKIARTPFLSILIDLVVLYLLVPIWSIGTPELCCSIGFKDARRITCTSAVSCSPPEHSRTCTARLRA